VHDVRARYFTEVSSGTKSEPVVRGAARHADYRTTQRIEVAQEEMRAALHAADARRQERASNTPANIPDTKSQTAVPDAQARPKVVRGGKP
jgi:hypothetical protein